MRLKTKLISTFAIIAILIGTAGYAGSYQLSNLASAYYIENEQLLPALASLSEMKETLPIIELEPSEYIQNPDPEHVEELDEAEEHMNEALSNYGKVAGQVTAMDMKGDVDNLFMMSRAILTLKDNNAPQDVLDQEFGTLDDKLDEFHDKLDSERVRITDELTLSVESLKNSIQFTYQLTIILSAIAAAIAIAVTYYLSHSISGPISRLKTAADQIGQGNYEVDTLVSNSSDEIGELCIHFGKMKQDLKNKEKMQNDFINIASHELRTPVQPIMSYTDLVSQGKVKADEAMKVISVQARRLHRLTNDILDVSRLESGRIVYNMESIGLNKLVSDFIAGLGVSLNAECKILTKFNCPEKVNIYADPIRMEQVLTNIIGNAIKFTRKGEVKIQTDYFSDKKQVEISVIDTGPGIPQEILPNLFGKFVTKDLRLEGQQGSGLGLFISKAIIQAHNGSITAQNSDGGHGATFRIILPSYGTVEQLESDDEGRTRQNEKRMNELAH
jgi:signal transduction histidine kinase